MQTGYFVRDTLVKYEVLQQLSEEKRAKIKALTERFNKLGYIDARTELGPSQAIRMTSNQSKSMQSTLLQVFEIEREIKELLKLDVELEAEDKLNRQQATQNKIIYLENSIRTLKNCCAHKLASPKDNATKRTLAEYEKEFISLTTTL